MQTQVLQDHVRQLLEAGQVECVIGYSVSPRNRTRPAFVYQSEDVETLVVNSHATYNLTKYLREKFIDIGDTGRVAVVVKPCDSKALNVLVAENKIDRSRVHVIGVECDGIFQSAKGEVLQQRCQGCDLGQPLDYDYLVSNGERKKEDKVRFEEGYRLSDFEALKPEEKAAFWMEQFDRCLRCYACRQVCPMCDCPTCLFERDDSMWVGPGSGIQEKRTFHLGRAYHLAGRCIGCNECERVCPVDFPIGLLNQVVAKELEAGFGFRAGFEPVPSPLLTVIGEKE
jgi:ferredoxin